MVRSIVQVLQVGRLDLALILLHLALTSACVSSVFMVLYSVYIKKNIVTFFALPFGEVSLVRLALDLVD